MSLKLIRPPSVEPVTVAEARAHLRLAHSDDDALLAGFVSAAREYVEAFQNRALVSQTWRLLLDAFPADRARNPDLAIRLPNPPLMNVVSVNYLDADGEPETMDEDDYRVDANSDPGRLRPSYGTFWPLANSDPGSVWIDYVAGYAANFTASESTEICTFAGDRAAGDGDVLRLVNSGGALPAPLVQNADYYVVSASGQTFMLSLASGGKEINLTSAGTGTHFAGAIPERVRLAVLLLVGHWYENREAVSDRPLSAAPLAVESLLWQERCFG